MIRRFLIFLALYLPAALFARNISVDRAREMAEMFFAGTATKTGQIQMVWDGEDGVTKSQDHPAFYVFNSGDGFVIISAYDGVSPVLAYSYEGRFVSDNMPENISFWMAGMRDFIKEKRAAEVPATDKVRREWKAFESVSTAPRYASGEVVLHTARWGQDAPFNNLCPIKMGGRCITGCVATASAIIMRYHKHPSQGSGTLPDYSSWDFGHELTAVYDWESMPLESVYDHRYNEEESAQVATLLYDVGIMCKMNYGVNGSGAYSKDAIKGLVQYMHYDAGVRLCFRSYYSQQEWFDLIKGEIDANCPVYYDGDSFGGGHAFVADGYNSAGHLSINWGWNGIDNGFYSIQNMGGYSNNNCAAIGLKPEAGGMPSSGVASYDSISSNVSSFSVNEPFAITLSKVRVQECIEFEGTVGIGKYDSTGRLEEILGEKDILLESEYYYSALTINCIIQTEIKPGDYIRPISRTSVSTWSPALFNQRYGDTEIISIYNPKLLLNNTSFEFDRSSRCITVNTTQGITGTLFGPQGAPVLQALSQTGSEIRIDISNLPSGTYTLYLSAGEIESGNIKFKL